MNFSAVILAGGQSRRMGRDKAWLQVEGQPLLARQIELVRELGAQEVFVSGRSGIDYEPFGCPVLYDSLPDAGPLGGIERALAVCASPTLLVLAVDMPDLTRSVLKDLKTRCVSGRGLIPRVAGRVEPLVAFYPKAAADFGRELLAGESRSVAGFAERCVRSGLADYCDLDEKMAQAFASWNTPQDLPIAPAWPS